MHLLIVDGEADAVKIMATKLDLAGFTTFATPSGQEALALAQTFDYDLIVLDLNLPDVNGVDVLRDLREGGVRTPVLVLSGSRDSEKMLLCFGLGADDFVTKPYCSDELAARIRAVILRSKGHASPNVTAGDIMIELETKRVTVAGRPMVLTRREYQVLELLVLRKGGIVTKDVFLDHLYGGLDEPDQKIIDVYVCKVRKKIAAMSKVGVFIETVWGRGYAMHEPAKMRIDHLLSTAA